MCSVVANMFFRLVNLCVPHSGECDLVLLQNPDFAHGLGMTIYMRTVIKSWWSYIESAVVQIGPNTLEIKGQSGQQDEKITYWLDGEEISDMAMGDTDAKLGDYRVHFKRISGHQSRTRIDLLHRDAIGIEVFKHFVRVNLQNRSGKQFVGSLGLMGRYPDGEKVARDGKTVLQDIDQFGLEWQVLASEPKLFHAEGSVQHPTTCKMPQDTTSQTRRLGEAEVTLEQANKACSQVAEEDFDFCVTDVLAVNDVDVAGAYF